MDATVDEINARTFPLRQAFAKLAGIDVVRGPGDVELRNGAAATALGGIGNPPAAMAAFLYPGLHKSAGRRGR